MDRQSKFELWMVLIGMSVAPVASAALVVLAR
jgi:hypothetical protein